MIWTDALIKYWLNTAGVCLFDNKSLPRLQSLDMDEPNLNMIGADSPCEAPATPTFSPKKIWLWGISKQILRAAVHGERAQDQEQRQGRSHFLPQKRPVMCSTSNVKMTICPFLHFLWFFSRFNLIISIIISYFITSFVLCFNFSTIYSEFIYGKREQNSR